MTGVKCECVNPNCDYVGLDSALAIGPGVSVTMFNVVSVGACPQCGSDLRAIDGAHQVLQDGTYIVDVARKSVNAFRASTSEDLASLAKLLQLIKSGSITSPDDVAAEVETNHAWFAPLFDKVREHRSDLIAVAALLLALIQVILMLRGDSGTVINNSFTTNSYLNGVVVEVQSEVPQLTRVQLEELVRQALDAEPTARSGPAKNSKCYCGSGRKYKNCHEQSRTLPEP